ncbi:MAG: DUF1223 domain-containing protein [Acidobacteriaceae bacterium]
MRFRYLVATSLMVIAVHSGLQAAQPIVPSVQKPNSVVIVELFTSEGCSSCPPADTLLQQVNLKETSAGQLILGISEHVTYWNNLGWKDPYSLPLFTERQSVYASHLSLEGPYTPQMVLNGRDQFVGSDGAALVRALRDESKRDHVDLSIVSLVPTGSALDVKFSLTGHVTKPLDIIAVLTDDADQSNVLRGENNGRLLQHVSVARSLTQVATVKGDAEQTVRILLPSEFEQGNGSGHHLILFAQEPHQGVILGATTKPL